MNISDTINIILSVLSFVLALISVVTVIITLGNLNAGCINKEQSSEEKRSNC